MIAWIKKNWLVLILVLIVLALINPLKFISRTISPSYRLNSTTESFSMPSMGSVANIGSVAYDSYQKAAPTTTADRIVIQDTGLSLLVSDVAKSITEIENLAKSFDGFLVNSNLYKPEIAGSGTIVVRVPEEKRSEALSAFKKIAVKVVSESVSGTDVTDQYEDLESKLVVLRQTKTKFEEILNKATAVNDLLNVQRELINIQTQIDNLIGQQKYYEQTAKLTKITIHLSTDELALPYTPDRPWRPSVIFKEAIRSLISTSRDLATFAIWSVVYIPVWVPVIAIAWIIRLKIKKSRTV